MASAMSNAIPVDIDAHPRLTRPVSRVPHLRISRDGATMHAWVKVRGSRKIRPDDITGHGDTPDEAADKLIASLDHWAAALVS